MLDGCERNAGCQQSSSVIVLRNWHAQPIGALCKRLEGTSRSVDAVVPSVWALRQAQTPPVLVDDLACRTILRRLWVRTAKDLRTEITPRELLRYPLCFKVMDASARGSELLPHLHIKPIDDVNGIDFPAVEAASKLYEIYTLAKFFPLAAKLLRGDAHGRSCVHGIEDLALLKGLIPRQAERFLELLLGLRLHSELSGLLLHCLRGDRAVVRVDELMLVDLFSWDGAL
mmetsp:Transcript_71656/g.160769  ORF Transcript_71656/g.160769 Transcript_71656/m.160769 type:complete len:229 (+) Transcript_71656:618-1304(+)